MSACLFGMKLRRLSLPILPAAMGAAAMMKQFQNNSYLFGGNAPYIEDLYESYLDNPGSVPDQWREYFDQMQLVPGAGKSAEDRDVAHAPIVESFAMHAKQGTLRP